MKNSLSRFSLAALAASLILTAGPAPAQDTAPYKTILTDGNFEVRDYPARRLAEFDLVGDQAMSAYAGFRVFADPTLPHGQPDERVVLETPVVETPAPSERFVTYPLFQVLDARVWTVSFDPPPGWTPGGLGYRKAPTIRWRDAPAQKIAVLRYDGRGGVWAPGLTWRQASRQILTQVARHGLKTEGPLMLAQYTSPQTPSVYRHFAVMIAVKDQVSSSPAPATPPR